MSKDFESVNFGDFLSDEDIEFEAPENPSGRYLKPTSVVLPNQTQPDDSVADAIERLQDSYGLQIDNYSVPEALRNVEKINTDDNAFDLVSSKIATDLLTRARLKGIIAMATSANRLFDFIINTYSDPNSEVSAESLLLMDKAAKAYNDMTVMLDKYKKTGIKESLKNLAKAREMSTSNETEEAQLTAADIQTLIRMAQQGN